MTAVRPARLDGVPLLVVGGIEQRRPSAEPASPLAAGDLVAPLWDGARDAARTQVDAISSRAVRLIRTHTIGPGARAARPEPGHPDGFEHRGQLRAVTALPTCDEQGQRPLALLAREVDLGCEPAPRAAQAVICRLMQDAAGRLFLQIAVSPCTGSVLVGTTDRGVDADFPGDQPQSIGPGLKSGDDPRPASVTLPATEEPVYRLPGPVPLG